ncbi:MAG: hypothetical protein IJJ41_07385 [Clostridia bacterium]|nr:hypothetical protein [Clostridia bacterium]
MNYQKLLKKIAKENNTTPQEVDKEMRLAIQAAGYDISPELFIALAAAKVQSEMMNGKQQNNK